MWAIISTISTDHWLDHEQVGVIIWVSAPPLSSPVCSNNSSLLFLPQRSMNTVNIVSHPHFPPLFSPIPNVFLCLQQTHSKYSFTAGPLLQHKVSEQVCASLHRPHCPSRYMLLLWAFGDISFTEQLHFIWCLHISTSHFLPPSSHIS